MKPMLTPTLRSSDQRRPDATAVLALLRARLPHLAHAFHPDARLADAGLDSLDFVELFVVIDEAYGVRLTDDQLAGAATVGEFAHLIVALASKPSANGASS
ncbi:MAG TPA: acyl carrier protein [Tepidisphaeraceae bacterium]|nr:acyl carrier protein [Tepidisphaeraceae bacterium]